MPKRRNKTEEKRIAKERIEILFKEAKNVFNEDSTMADKYVEKARKLAMKYKVRIPRDLKRRFCKHCYSYLMPGKTVRVRTKDGKVVMYCLKCKKFMRFVISKK